MKTNFLKNTFFALFFMLAGMFVYINVPMAQIIKGKTVIPSQMNQGFIENKGQILDQNNQPNPVVKYLLCMKGLNVQLRSNGFSYDAYIVKKIDPKPPAEGELPFPPELERFDFNLQFHRIDVEFSGAATQPVIIAEQPGSDYLNYYTTGTPEEGALFVKHYGKITYKDLYPGIDLVFVAKPGTTKPVEYYFIVHPGADLAKIQWKYDGSDQVLLTGQNIQIKTAFGDLNENIPYSFLQETGKSVNIRYTVNMEGIFGFDGTTDRKNTLVIDPIPNLKWASYYGGSVEEILYGVTTDINGNMLITGYSSSTTAIATAGAHQTTFGGVSGYSSGMGDAIIVKFDRTGARLWATYLGGALRDQGQSIKTDNSGNIYMSGTTTSTTAIATTGAFQTTISGTYFDVFLEKFDASGVRQWGTYFGGSGNDRGSTNGMAIDASGNVYICGTNNTANNTWITTPGAYQRTNLSTSAYDEPFAAKFSPSGTLIWGTYYGGTLHDVCYGLALDASNNVYLTGTCTSTSLIATTGAFQTTIGGGTTDAFVAKLNSTGSALLWGTYLGGSLADAGMGLTVDANGNVYVAGYTVSTSGITTTGSYQPTYAGGGYDAFLAKFNSSGQRVWGTYYGGSGDDFFRGIAMDANGNILVAGDATSTSGIATAGSYQSTLAGGREAILVKFNQSGQRLWGTYYGGALEDIAWPVEVDANGNLYIVGRTVSTSGIATAGSFQTTNAGGTYDGFIAKFEELVGYNNAGINKLLGPGSYFCSGNQDVKVEITNAGFNSIDSVMVMWQVNGVNQTPVKVKPAITSGSSRTVVLGNINFPLNSLKNIKAWTSMPNGVPDTVKVNDTITAQRKPGLNGTYTIGGTSPDFATFGSAVSDLNSFGICGPVVFNVRAGTYNERFTLNQVAGASSTNRITFKGSGKSGTILTSAGTGTTDMATILFNGADQVTFMDMTISNTGSAYGAAIWLTGATDTLKFVNLNLQVDTLSNSANVNCMIISGSATSPTTDGITGNYCLFDSLLLNGGTYGLRINGPNTTSSYSVQNTVSNCIFINQYQYGLYMRNQSYPVISNNQFKPLRYTTGYTVYLDYSANIEVKNNNIQAGDCGMYLNYVNKYLVNTSFTSRIFNNMITSVGGYAFYCNQSALLKLWHNSFSAEPAISVLRFVSSATTDFVDNHILNRSNIVNRYAVHADVITTFSTMDYNNYFTAGGLFNIASLDYGNLPVLQAAFSQFNQNSYNQDPLFFSTSDLHTSINLTGIYVGIDQDIDGDFRNTVSPVLGADEVNIPNNAGISGLISPVPAFCAGLQDVIVKIGNYGINQIDSVWVHWKVNGVNQTSVNVKTAIGLRGFLDVTLGSVSFATGENKVFKIWTSMPNGVTDPFRNNDTLVIRSETGLSGTYTVGGTAPDYADFTQAVSALTRLGVCSPVVFEVRAGTYNEKISIGEIKGTSAFNTVTFKGAGKSNTNLSFSGTSVNDWSTLMLKGTDHVIFRNMTISAMGTNYGIGVLLTSQADSNQFINVTVQSSVTSTSVNLAGIAVMSNPTNFYASAGQPGNGNLFDSLEVSGGYYGIYLFGNSDNQTVSHSAFSDQYVGSIEGMFQNYLRVSHNKVGSLRSSSYSYALFFSDITNFDINSNTINIGGEAGIYILNGNLAGSDSNFRSVVFNNMVSNTVGYSLNCESVLSTSILHNSFRSVGNSVTTLAAASIKVSSGIDMRNNQIRNDNPNSYAFYSDLGTFDTCDYNNYYSFGNFAVFGSVYSNLSALKSGLPQFNQNSYSQNPQYISLTDLHTTSFLPGIYVGINYDIDGEPRCPATISVGADDENWGFSKPVITPAHTNFFTNYPVSFNTNISSTSGIKYKWFIDTSYVDDSISLRYVFTSPGTYKITLRATRCIYQDSAFYMVTITPGNKLITLLGDNPDTIRVFTPYIEPGYTAKDFFGNDITALVITGNNVDTAVLGSYDAWYKVEDSWNNRDSVIRKVVVIDDVPPVITLNGSDTMTIEVFQNINDPGAMVTDNYDTGLSVTTDSSFVNKNVVGIYKLEYSAVDNSGNKGTKTRFIKVVDNGLPVIDLIGQDTVIVDVYSQYFEAGAKVSDNYCTSGMQWQVDVYPSTDVLDTFILTYTASDCQGNFAVPVNRVVMVVDRQKPVIELIGNPYVIAERWTSYTDQGVHIYDNYYSEDTLLKLVVKTGYVEIIEPGIYYICYQVTDPSGNISVKECRIVEVKCTSGLDENSSTSAVLFPNPGTGKFTIKLDREPSVNAMIKVFDMTGKMVYNNLLTSRKSEFDLEFLETGIYLVKILDNDRVDEVKVNIIR